VKFADILHAVHPRTHPVRLALAAGTAAAAVLLLWLCWPMNFRALLDHNPGKTRLMEIREQQARRKGVAYRIRHRWVPLRRIAEPLRKAVIAAEDDAFYQHHGVDLTAIRVSLKNNWKKKTYAQGGSTITQQVVKNLYLSPKKSMLRKLREAALALQMERALSKRRILEIYLNIAEWGRGVYGAEAAARHYFGKPAADLTLDEAVALVAVLPSPLKHSPVRQDRFLKWRKAWVLRQLRYTGYLPKPAEPEQPEPIPEWILEENRENGEGAPESFANTPAAAGEPIDPAAPVEPAPTAEVTAGPESGEATTLEELEEEEATPEAGDEDEN